MRILVKVSGDLQERADFYNWLGDLRSQENEVFILCGGGSAITNELEKENLTSSFGPNGREITSELGRIIAHKVLQKQKSKVVRELKKRNIKASVLVPALKVSDKILHLNGDNLATSLYPNFDRIFILTMKGRKKTFPKHLNKISVIKL